MFGFLDLLYLISLIAPFGVLYMWTGSLLGEGASVLIGFVLQLVIGVAIFLYHVRLKTKLEKFFSIGLIIFFVGLSGTYLAKKTIWLPVFWELSSFGAVLMYFRGTRMREQHFTSIISMLTASGISGVFLMAWVFLPVDNFYGQLFLLLALLLKSAFSMLHIWYSDFHKGASPELSALFSGIGSVMPTLLFLKFLLPDFSSEILYRFLIPLSGLGVFLGGVTSFFSKDLKRAFAMSTVEKINFLWLCLFLAGFWKISPDPATQFLSEMFLVLFFLTLIHHSISKTFQFLSFGYIESISGTSIIDENRGVGRNTGVSSLVLGLGTFSYILVPGTLGFLSESTYLFVMSKIVDLPKGKAFAILPALVFIVLGLVLGSMAHLKIYLSVVLSIPKKGTNTFYHGSSSVTLALKYLGLLLFCLTPITIGFFQYSEVLSSNTKLMFHDWFINLFWISIGSSLVFLWIVYFDHSQEIKKRKLWDCGNNYAGEELSIPGSVISDPLYDSLGTIVEKEEGISRVDKWFLRQINQFLQLGRYWIINVESGQLSNYIAFSSVSLLLTLAIILFIRFYKDLVWKFLTM